MILAVEMLSVNYTSIEYTAIAPDGQATQSVKLEANKYHRQRHAILFFMYYIALRRIKFPATVGSPL